MGIGVVKAVAECSEKFESQNPVANDNNYTPSGIKLFFLIKLYPK